MFQPDQGCIEVICGSMFSGKSEELIRRVKRALLARQQVQVFKPVLDNRYNKESVTSHSGASFEALPVAKAEDILTQLAPGVKVVGIDEVQFFDQSIVAVCQQLADQGKRVIVAGLDQDFRGEPFGPVPTLLAVAEVIDKLHAVCMSCGRTASRSQRFVNGEVARADDSTIKIGAEQIYEARCRACHKVVKDGGSQAEN